jgi:hypothetical protein
MQTETPRSLKLGIHLLTALLWLGALGSAAYWVLRYQDRSELAPANARELSMAAPAQALNWGSLAARFGVEAKGPVVTDVKVLGVVLPAGGKQARVVLLIENTKTTVVAEVGKEITDGPLAGAVVARITPLEVTLNRSAGQSQKLPVPDATDPRMPTLVNVTPNSSNRLAQVNQAPRPDTGVPNAPNNAINSAIQAGNPNFPAGVNAANAAVQAAAQAAAQGALGAAQQPQQPPPAPVMNGADGVNSRQPKANK